MMRGLLVELDQSNAREITALETEGKTPLVIALSDITFRTPEHVELGSATLTSHLIKRKVHLLRVLGQSVKIIVLVSSVDFAVSAVETTRGREFESRLFGEQRHVLFRDE